jgi:DNA-binding XRE family transcriptional regulator
MDVERPPPNDAELLLRLVRGMTATDFSGAFRHGLSAQELMAVITALPTGRLNELTDRARLLVLPAEQQRQHHQRQRLAATIADARDGAGMSQTELARRIGVASAEVSQWEAGVTQPTGLHLASLLHELPELKELLEELHDQPPPAVQASG